MGCRLFLLTHKFQLPSFIYIYFDKNDYCFHPLFFIFTHLILSTILTIQYNSWKTITNIFISISNVIRAVKLPTLCWRVIDKFQNHCQMSNFGNFFTSSSCGYPATRIISSHTQSSSSPYQLFSAVDLDIF